MSSPVVVLQTKQTMCLSELGEKLPADSQLTNVDISGVDVIALHVMYGGSLSTQRTPLGRFSFFGMVMSKVEQSAGRKQYGENGLQLLMTVWMALGHFLHTLEGHHILIRTDNTTVLSRINRRSLSFLPHLIFDMKQSLPVIPSQSNLGAGLLSRQEEPQILDCFGRPNINRFTFRKIHMDWTIICLEESIFFSVLLV